MDPLGCHVVTMGMVWRIRNANGALPLYTTTSSAPAPVAAIAIGPRPKIAPMFAATGASRTGSMAPDATSSKPVSSGGIAIVTEQRRDVPLQLKALGLTDAAADCRNAKAIVASF